MTMGHHQPTATILAFPAQAGTANRIVQAGTDPKAGRIMSFAAGRRGETQAPQVLKPHFMDSWYHQAAIDETAPARKS